MYTEQHVVQFAMALRTRKLKAQNHLFTDRTTLQRVQSCVVIIYSTCIYPPGYPPGKTNNTVVYMHLLQGSLFSKKLCLQALLGWLLIRKPMMMLILKLRTCLYNSNT